MTINKRQHGAASHGKPTFTGRSARIDSRLDAASDPDDPPGDFYDKCAVTGGRAVRRGRPAYVRGRNQESTPFIMSITTTLGDGSTDFIIPLDGVYDATIDWGDGNTDVITGEQEDVLHTYAEAGTYDVSITENKYGGFSCLRWALDSDGDNAKKVVDIKQWGSCNWTTLYGMFRGCTGLTVLSATDKPNLAGVTLLTSLFYGCTGLTELDLEGWDTSHITDMSYMIRNCSNLTTVKFSTWDVSNVQSIAVMAYACPKLVDIDVSKWDTSSMTNISWAFNSCSTLPALDVTDWDVSNVTNAYAIFSGCYVITDLPVGKWKLTSATNLAYMFRNCRKMVEFDIAEWSTPNATTFEAIFSNCYLLKKADATNLDMNGVTNLNAMFDEDYALEDIGDISGWDTSTVQSMQVMLNDCRVLPSSFIAGAAKFDISSLTNATGFASQGTSMDQADYDALLIAWEAQGTSNCTLGVSSTYTADSDASVARAALVSRGWTITDGGAA